MKKISLLIIAVSVITACKKEQNEEAPKTNAELIVGEWSLVKTVANEYENGVLIDTDENFQTGTFSIKCSGDYVLILGVNDTDDMGTYHVTEDSLFLNSSESYSFKLQKLTENELEFLNSEFYDFDTVSYRDDYIFYFNK